MAYTASGSGSRIFSSFELHCYGTNCRSAHTRHSWLETSRPSKASAHNGCVLCTLNLSNFGVRQHQYSCPNHRLCLRGLYGSCSSAVSLRQESSQLLPHLPVTVYCDFSGNYFISCVSLKIQQLPWAATVFSSLIAFTICHIVISSRLIWFQFVPSMPTKTFLKKS
jgi:hypothetical protein